MVLSIIITVNPLMNRRPVYAVAAYPGARVFTPLERVSLSPELKMDNNLLREVERPSHIAVAALQHQVIRACIGSTRPGNAGISGICPVIRPAAAARPSPALKILGSDILIGTYHPGDIQVIYIEVIAGTT